MRVHLSKRGVDLQQSSFSSANSSEKEKMGSRDPYDSALKEDPTQRSQGEIKLRKLPVP